MKVPPPPPPLPASMMPARATTRLAPPPPPIPPSMRPPLPAAPTSVLAPVDVFVPDTVNAHVRRVTLNLIRCADCCPAPLRRVLEHLSSDLAWDVAKLTKTENELIYGHVDEKLADAAKDEFEVDLSSIVDHRACDAMCRLCGHQHNRWEFKLRNKFENDGPGRSLWVGSTCVEEYGLNVEGAATAEEALKRLRSAISKAKQKAERDDWQDAHPNHRADIARIDNAMATVWRPTVTGRLPDYAMWRFLPNDFRRTSRKLITVVKAVIKYYQAHEFLTDLRTSHVYAPNGLLAKAVEHTDAWNKAIDAVNEVRNPKPIPVTEPLGRIDNSDLPFV